MQEGSEGQLHRLQGLLLIGETDPFLCEALPADRVNVITVGQHLHVDFFDIGVERRECELQWHLCG